MKKKLGSMFPFRVLVWTEFKFEVGSKTSILNKKLEKKKENERMKTKDEKKLWVWIAVTFRRQYFEF